MTSHDAIKETPYERHVRECREAGIPLANAPFVRCDCDYFEGAVVDDEHGVPGVADDLCECGHSRDDHEDRSDACMEQEGGSKGDE